MSDDKNSNENIEINNSDSRHFVDEHKKRQFNPTILELVKECMRYNFTNYEAIRYIQVRGYSISDRHYYRMKKYLKSDPSITAWLSEYARVGFALAHRDRIEEIQSLMSKAWRMLAIEENKPYESQKKELILKIYGEIRELNKRLTELSLASPIISEIKAQINESRHTISKDDRQEIIIPGVPEPELVEDSSQDKELILDSDNDYIASRIQDGLSSLDNKRDQEAVF